MYLSFDTADPRSLMWWVRFVGVGSEHSQTKAETGNIDLHAFCASPHTRCDLLEPCFCRLHGDSSEKGAGLGLQLRVYRGVPLVNLNAIAPDKKVEVRPQVRNLNLAGVVETGTLVRRVLVSFSMVESLQPAMSCSLRLGIIFLSRRVCVDSWVLL